MIEDDPVCLTPPGTCPACGSAADYGQGHVHEDDSLYRQILDNHNNGYHRHCMP